MNKRKTIEDLTIQDNFMFAAVMMTDTENCRKVIEYALGISVDRVEVVPEKTIIYHPEYKGIRLDVYAKEVAGDKVPSRHFNLEMQIGNKKIFKRSRYYHSQIDMEILGRGVSYDELPDTYVIFICDYDPVGLKKYRYTRHCVLKEDNSYEYSDGTHTVFLSTKGTNEEEVPESLVRFLKYVGAGKNECEKDYDDELVRRLQNTVRRIKSDREMGAKYMLLEEMMKDEYNAGVSDGIDRGIIEGRRKTILYILSKYGNVSRIVAEKLANITDDGKMDILVEKAIAASSIDEFENEIDKL